MYASRFCATDVDEAEAHLRARYGSLALSDSGVRFGERVRGDATFALVEHDYEGACSIGGELDVVAVVLPHTADGFEWEAGDERGRGSGQPMLFQPGQPFITNVEGARLRAVVFDREQLAREASALFATDISDVRFDSARPLSRAVGRVWASLVEFATERDDPAYQLVHASLRSTLTRLLLEAFPLVDRPADERARSVSRWLGYRRALDFIEANASLPITVSDIASAAGLSLRELAAAFRDHARGGSTPLGTLRRSRLEAVRHELRTGDPSVETIGEIALRWGFASISGFTRSYHEAFGVDPAEERLRSS